MKVRPSSLKEANAFVVEHHRHHGPARGCKFCLKLVDADGTIRAVAVVSRPVARALDDGLTAEVVRLCSDGTFNACSQLYAACRRTWLTMGGERMITYTLASETGASLRAAGWGFDEIVKGRSWSCPSRPRTDKHPTEDKVRWVA